MFKKTNSWHSFKLYLLSFCILYKCLLVSKKSQTFCFINNKDHICTVQFVRQYCKIRKNWGSCGFNRLQFIMPRSFKTGICYEFMKRNNYWKMIMKLLSMKFNLSFVFLLSIQIHRIFFRRSWISSYNLLIEYVEKYRENQDTATAQHKQFQSLFPITSVVDDNI